MFVKRAFLLAVLLVSAFAQDTRDLAVSKANEKGPIKVVKNEDDVYALASRWAASLKAGWDTEDGELDTSSGSTPRTAPSPCSRARAVLIRGLSSCPRC